MFQIYVEFLLEHLWNEPYTPLKIAYHLRFQIPIKEITY